MQDFDINTPVSGIEMLEVVIHNFNKSWRVSCKYYSNNFIHVKLKVCEWGLITGLDVFGYIQQLLWSFKDDLKCLKHIEKYFFLQSSSFQKILSLNYHSTSSITCVWYETNQLSEFWRDNFIYSVRFFLFHDSSIKLSENITKVRDML